MTISKKNFVNVDLKDGIICRSFMNRPIGGGDATADIFGAHIYENHEPASLNGAVCVGYFIRPDGITLVINGTVSGNDAYVELPEAAYAKPGNYELTIKISGSGYSNTIRIIDGTVVETTTGNMNDPSSTIPSLADLLAVIGDAEDAADEIDSLSVGATLISGTRYKISVTKTT